MPVAPGFAMTTRIAAAAAVFLMLSGPAARSDDDCDTAIENVEDTVQIATKVLAATMVELTKTKPDGDKEKQAVKNRFCSASGEFLGVSRAYRSVASDCLRASKRRSTLAALDKSINRSLQENGFRQDLQLSLDMLRSGRVASTCSDLRSFPAQAGIQGSSAPTSIVALGPHFRGDERLIDCADLTASCFSARHAGGREVRAAARCGARMPATTRRLSAITSGWPIWPTSCSHEPHHCSGPGA